MTYGSSKVVFASPIKCLPLTRIREASFVPSPDGHWHYSTVNNRSGIVELQDDSILCPYVDGDNKLNNFIAYAEVPGSNYVIFDSPRGGFAIRKKINGFFSKRVYETMGGILLKLGDNDYGDDLVEYYNNPLVYVNNNVQGSVARSKHCFSPVEFVGYIATMKIDDYFKLWISLVDSCCSRYDEYEQPVMEGVLEYDEE